MKWRLSQHGSATLPLHPALHYWLVLRLLQKELVGPYDLAHLGNVSDTLRTFAKVANLHFVLMASRTLAATLLTPRLLEGKTERRSVICRNSTY